MNRKLLLAATAALVVGSAGCRHRCCRLNEPGNRPSPYLPDAPRNPTLLPPANLPTTPSVLPPGTSGFPPPASLDPLTNPSPAPKSGGTETLFPDPLPGGASSRPTQPVVPGFLGAPVKPQPETPKANTAGLPGYTKVKDGLFAGGKPTLDGFDALKTMGFRSVAYFHAAGADVSAVKDMAATRGLQFHAVETTPESLADASAAFNRVAADRLNRPLYAFGQDASRAGAVWYLHLRTVDALGDDVARLRAKPLGLSEDGDEGRAFALAIQRVLETK